MIIFKNRLSTGWFCLPSELVISLPQTFKYKRNIKNQEQSLRILYTIQKPAPTIEPRPAKTSPNSRSVPDNLAARTYPEKVKSQAQALNIMRFQNLCPSCHMNNSLLHRHKITSISQILGASINHHWVRLYSIQLWTRRAADVKAAPSLSDICRLKWSDAISNMIEAENEKMTPDCCSSISISKNALLFSRSYLSQPGQVMF